VAVNVVLIVLKGDLQGVNVAQCISSLQTQHG